MKNTIARFISAATTVAVLATGAQATAAASSLSINPASGVYTKGNNFTVSIVETGDNINVVTAILSYDASKLICNGIGAGEFSSDAAPATCTNGQVYVSRFVSGGATLSGSHTVATINFTAIASGTTSLTFGAGSQVVSAGVNTLSGSTGATYTLTAPTTSTPTTPTTGGNTGTIRLNPVATSSTSTGRSNVSPTTSPENNAATNQPAVLSETQKKKEDKQSPTVASTSTIQKSNTGANVAKLVALIALAGGIVVAQRYRANQLATANAAALAAAAAKKTATKKAPAKAKKTVKKTARKK